MQMTAAVFKLIYRKAELINGLPCMFMKWIRLWHTHWWQLTKLLYSCIDHSLCSAKAVDKEVRP